MEIKGKVINKMPEVTGQGKNGPWKRQEFVIEIQEGQFPRKVCISTWNDKADLKNINTNDVVNVSFDLESREYNGRWYTDVKAWKVEKAGGSEDARDNMSQERPEESYIPPADD